MSSSNFVAPTQQASHAAARASAATLGAVIYTFGALLVLHFLRPEYDPVLRVISNYAVGPYGFLMTSAFFAIALSMLSLTFAIHKGVVPAGRSRAGLILLTAAGVGFLIVAIFPTDVTPDDSPTTTVGAIHILASVTSLLLFIVAALLLSRRFRKDSTWLSFRRTPLRLALACLAAFIAFFAIKAANLPIGGVGQRVLVITVLLWLSVTGNHLRHVSLRSAKVVEQEAA